MNTQFHARIASGFLLFLAAALFWRCTPEHYPVSVLVAGSPAGIAVKIISPDSVAAGSYFRVAVAGPSGDSVSGIYIYGGTDRNWVLSGLRPGAGRLVSLYLYSAGGRLTHTARDTVDLAPAETSDVFLVLQPVLAYAVFNLQVPAGYQSLVDSMVGLIITGGDTVFLPLDRLAADRYHGVYETVPVHASAGFGLWVYDTAGLLVLCGADSVYVNAGDTVYLMIDLFGAQSAVAINATVIAPELIIIDARFPGSVDTFPPLTVVIDSPRTGTVSDSNVVWIGGRLLPADSAAGLGSTVIIRANQSLVSAPRTNGLFGCYLTIDADTNWIRAGARRASGDTVWSDSVLILGRFAAKALTVRLTWDQADCDVDMHIWDPDGKHIYYGRTTSPSGGSLDLDNTTGLGPETFTQTNALTGQYFVRVNYFSTRIPGRQTSATVEISVPGQPLRRMGPFLLTQPGLQETPLGSWWDAAYITMPAGTIQ
jgi:hypothetical protein